MNARRRLAWLPLGLLGGLLLIAVGHFLGLFPAAETISPVRVQHTFPPRISSTNFTLDHTFTVSHPNRWHRPTEAAHEIHKANGR